MQSLGNFHSMNKFIVAIGVTSASLLLIGSAETPQIFFRTQAQADAALERFDRDNPSCELWTNWQKMCSRTGEGGTTICIRDSRVSVRPSVPFCVGRAHEAGPTTIASGMRFCEVSDTFGMTDRNGTRNVYPVCDKFKKERPFNGRRLRERLSPICIGWTSRETGKILCSDAHDARAPSCHSKGVQNTHSNTGFYCSQYRESSCGRGAIDPNSGGIIFMDTDGISAADFQIFGVDKTAVNGTICGGER